MFAKEVLGVSLDPDQVKILESVQYNPMTAVSSGTARGKDFVTAVACICFLYLTPKWKDGQLISNTKVAMTAPTGRQVNDIMMAELGKMFNKAKNRGFTLPGRLLANGIKTLEPDWFLSGFKADDNSHEAWTGVHADNVMFAVTEASGMAESVFTAIEGNLQNNSRLLIVFNPNISTGYAANSLRSSRFNSFKLDCLNAPNVVNYNQILSGEIKPIPGQVNYEWVDDKVKAWCSPISENDVNEGEGDFIWTDGNAYHPNDIFRIKVRGMFPKEAEDTLIPLYWVELANERWNEWKQNKGATGYIPPMPYQHLRLGVDVAAEGSDSNSLAYRYGWIVTKIDAWSSKGVETNIPELTGKVANILKDQKRGIALIDTIGVGSGVHGNLKEMKDSSGYYLPDASAPDHRSSYVKNISIADRVYSAKGSFMVDYRDKPFTDERTKQIEMLNARAYMHWEFREWLNPLNKTGAAIPPIPELTEEITAVKYSIRGNGKLQIEEKDAIKKRIGRSPDRLDSVLLTFFKEKPLIIGQPFVEIAAAFH